MREQTNGVVWMDSGSLRITLAIGRAKQAIRSDSAVLNEGAERAAIVESPCKCIQVSQRPCQAESLCRAALK